MRPCIGVVSVCMYTVRIRTARVKVCRGMLCLYGWCWTLHYGLLTGKNYIIFNGGVAIVAVFEATVELAFFCTLQLYFDG